jgi:hypothetical protein
MKLSKKVKNRNAIDIYEIPLINLTGKHSAFERYSFGNPEEQAEHRTILVFGTNGLIQAKFINGIVNFMLNIKKKDKFRFQLIDEEVTIHRKNCIRIYYIHHSKGFRVPYSLTIVVSPRFGNSEDSQLLRNQKLAEMFQEVLEDIDGIKELDMICNVMEKTDNHQLDLSVFGKDAKENINNLQPFSCLDETSSWKIKAKRFFFALAKKNKLSLSLTILVLEERKKIEATLAELHSLIKIGHSKKKEIKKAKQLIQFCESQINCNDQMNKSFALNITQNVNLQAKKYVPSCNNCFLTCNKLSVKRENEENYTLNLLTINEAKNNIYFACSENSINIDSNQNYKWTYVENESRNLHVNPAYATEMKWKDIMLKGQDLIKQLKEHLIENGTVMLKLFQKTWQCIQRLNEMSLSGNSFLTTKVFNFIFDAEQHLKKIGFKFNELKL